MPLKMVVRNLDISKAFKSTQGKGNNGKTHHEPDSLNHLPGPSPLTHPEYLYLKMNECFVSRAVALRRNDNEKTVEKNNDGGQGKVECKKMNVKVEEKDAERKKRKER
jgi:hypothetical protein